MKNCFPSTPILLCVFSLFSLIYANDSAKVLMPGGVVMTLVKIPAGSFQMGSVEVKGSAWNTCDYVSPCDKPQHEVVFSYDYYIGKFEVTQEQWNAVMDTNPSMFKSCPTCPVEMVSWDDCKIFLEKLNELGNGTFKLPSEAEWEYACQAGSTTRFFFGDSICGPTDAACPLLDEYAWWGGNSAGATKPAGLLKPNNWGLHDMLGNVYEWCEDDFVASGYGVNPLTDGSAYVDTSTKTTVKSKTTRGAWKGYNEPRRYRSAFRSGHEQNMRHGCCGVRIVRDDQSFLGVLMRSGKGGRPDGLTVNAYHAGGIVRFIIQKSGASPIIGPLRICDIKGRTIEEIALSPASAGKNLTAQWNGATNAGGRAGSGVYFAWIGQYPVYRLCWSR